MQSDEANAWGEILAYSFSGCAAGRMHTMGTVPSARDSIFGCAVGAYTMPKSAWPSAMVRTSASAFNVVYRSRTEGYCRLIPTRQAGNMLYPMLGLDTT